MLGLGVGLGIAVGVAVGELGDGALGAVPSAGVDGAQPLTKAKIETPITRFLGVSTPSPYG